MTPSFSFDISYRRIECTSRYAIKNGKASCRDASASHAKPPAALQRRQGDKGKYQHAGMPRGAHALRACARARRRAGATRDDVEHDDCRFRHRRRWRYRGHEFLRRRWSPCRMPFFYDMRPMISPGRPPRWRPPAAAVGEAMVIMAPPRHYSRTPHNAAMAEAVDALTAEEATTG